MTEYPTYRKAVKNLQRYLRRLSEEEKDLDKYTLAIDGIYGDETRRAITEFQKSRGLSPTGKVNEVTWNALFLEYLELIRENDKKVYPDFFPRTPDNYATDIGEVSAFVSLLQLMIDELRIAYGTLPPFAMNGVYDEDTAGAVREFQRLSGIAETGKVDLKTWNRISAAYNAYATQSR